METKRRRKTGFYFTLFLQFSYSVPYCEVKRDKRHPDKRREQGTVFLFHSLETPYFFSYGVGKTVPCKWRLCSTVPFLYPFPIVRLLRLHLVALTLQPSCRIDIFLEVLG